MGLLLLAMLQATAQLHSLRVAFSFGAVERGRGLLQDNTLGRLFVGKAQHEIPVGVL